MTTFYLHKTYNKGKWQRIVTLNRIPPKGHWLTAIMIPDTTRLDWQGRLRIWLDGENTVTNGALVAAIALLITNGHEHDR